MNVFKRERFCGNWIHFAMIFFFFSFYTTECFFGDIDADSVFLIFKMYVYFPRDVVILNFAILKVIIIKVRKIEEETAKNNACKNQNFRRKCDVLQHL